MRGTRPSGGRDRGTTPALTYVLAIGIVTLLISGLLIATTDFVDGERERVVRDELEIVGERLAADAVAVDRLASDGATTTQRTTVPETVADVGYYVDVVGCPSGNACLALTSADPSMDVNVTVPMNNRSAVSLTRNSPQTVQIDVVAGADPSPGVDADRSVAPSIGIARNVSPGLDSSGDLFEADTTPVVSGIKYSPAPPALDDPVSFESDVTTFVDGNYTYRWDLDGDGTVDETGNATEAAAVSYTYSDPGRYNVSLQVIGPNNQSDTLNRLVRVSGVVLSDPSVGATSEDVDGNGDVAGLQVDLRNNFASDSVTITDVEIDPADPSVQTLDNFNGAEIQIGTTDTYTGPPITLYEDGRLVELGPPSDPIPVGGTTRLTLGEFYDGSGQYPTSGQTFEVAVRYETSAKENYVSRFSLTPDTAAPTPTPGPGPAPPSITDVATQCNKITGNEYKTSTTVTATDPNDNLEEATIELFRQPGNSGNLKSVDEITVSFNADGDPVTAEYTSSKEIVSVEVTVYDGAGNPSTTVSESTGGCT